VSLMVQNVAIEVKNLTKIFPGNPRPLTVFEDFSISFEKGKVTAIVGSSGCGKSTLLRMIAGLEKTTQGSILFSMQNNSIGMIFQEKALFPWRTVESNVAFGLELADVPKTEHKDIINYWLDKTGLIEFKNYYPTQLSGGMKQRLAFARSMAVDPDIVLLDEPFSSLDTASHFELLDLIEKQQLLYDKTSIFVTHNLREAAYVSDYIYKLGDRPINSYHSYFIKERHPRTAEFAISNEFNKLTINIGSSNLLF